MRRAYETFSDFMHDLDESSSLSDDPFGVDPSIGSLDDEDLEILGYGRAKKPAAKPAEPPSPKKKPAKKPA